MIFPSYTGETIMLFAQEEGDELFDAILMKERESLCYCSYQRREREGLRGGKEMLSTITS